MTVYVYSKVAVYAELGGALRLARNSRAFATDPVTGASVNVTQGAFTAPYLDTDNSGIADFTATTLGPIRLTTGGTFVDVFSEDLLGSLGSTYAPQPGKAKLPGIGRGVQIPGKANPLVYGANLGIGPNSLDTVPTWTTSYDQAYQHEKIDRVADLGCNTTRVLGNYTSYAANPTQYIARVKDTIDYAHSRGLKVLFAFLMAIDDNARGNLTSSLRTQYQGYFAAMTAIYGGNKMMLGWDVGNEIAGGATADFTLLIANAVADIRALDPVTPITSSICGVGYTNLDAIQSADAAGVDFQDIHIYHLPYSTDAFYPMWIEDLKQVTTKPILFGEFGSNLSMVAGAFMPHVTNESLQAAQMRSMRRYASVEQVMGFMPWVIEDDEATNMYGLYAPDGTPREQLGTFLRFPAQADAAAQDAVAYRTTPVVVADFQQADNAAVIPAQPIGGAPSFVYNTWGIASRMGRVMSSTNGWNFCAWETNTADADLTVEMNFTAGNTTHAGLICRLIDGSNYIACTAQSVLGSGATGHETEAGIRLDVTVAGVSNCWGFWPLPAPIPYGATLRVVLRYDKIYVYYHDKLLGRVSYVMPHIDATQHGIWTNSDLDQATLFRRFVASVPLRTY